MASHCLDVCIMDDGQLALLSTHYPVTAIKDGLLITSIYDVRTYTTASTTCKSGVFVWLKLKLSWPARIPGNHRHLILDWSKDQMTMVTWDSSHRKTSIFRYMFVYKTFQTWLLPWAGLPLISCVRSAALMAHGGLSAAGQNDGSLHWQPHIKVVAASGCMVSTHGHIDRRTWNAVGSWRKCRIVDVQYRSVMACRKYQLFGQAWRWFANGSHECQQYSYSQPNSPLCYISHALTWSKQFFVFNKRPMNTYIHTSYWSFTSQSWRQLREQNVGGSTIYQKAFHDWKKNTSTVCQVRTIKSPTH